MIHVAATSTLFLFRQVPTLLFTHKRVYTVTSTPGQEQGCCPPFFPHRSAADTVVERPLAHTRHVADARRPPLSICRSMPALQAVHLSVRSDSRHRTHLCQQTHLSPRRSLSTRGAYQGARKTFHPHGHGPQRVQQRSCILLPKKASCI